MSLLRSRWFWLSLFYFILTLENRAKSRFSEKYTVFVVNYITSELKMNHFNMISIDYGFGDD